MVNYFKSLFSKTAMEEQHMGVLTDRFPMFTEESKKLYNFYDQGST